MAHDTVLKTVSPESVGIPSEAITAFVRRVKEWKLREHSLIVLRHGDICAEGYAPVSGEDKLHRMYSVSKTFVTAGIGRLIFEGKLHLDDKVVSFFPDKIKGPIPEELAETTVRHLLMMATPHTDGTYTWSPDCTNWTNDFFTAPCTHVPGTIFRYDTSGTYVLSVLVERLSGKPIMEYLKSTIFAKAGFSKDAWCVKAPEGNSWCGSGVMCTSRDLAKLAIIFKDGGRWNGEQVLPEDFVREATSCMIDNNFKGRAENCVEGYGYGYFVWRTWRGSYSFWGMGDQFAVTVPDKDIILIATADNQGSPCAAPNLFEAFWDCVVDRATDGPLPENSEALAEMQREIGYLPLPIIDGDAHSLVENEIDGRVFRATRPNEMGITEFSFRFFGDVGEFHYTNARGAKVIRFGLGKYEDGTLQESYSGARIHEPCDHEYKTTACAVFVEPHKLVLRCDVVDWYFGNLTATFGFKGDACGFRMVKNAEDFMRDYFGWGEGRAEGVNV